MQQETITLTLPGLSRNYTFFQTSDCHIACAEPDATIEEKALAEKETKLWSYAGLLPVDAFDEVLRIADEEHADGLFLCGDVADYAAKAITDYIRDRLSHTSTEILYVCGNHERSFVSREAAETRGFYSEYADMMHGSPALWTRDYGEFLIVGMDDGDKQIRQEQMDGLKALFQLHKPILLLIHIPIFTDAIIGPVKEKWGENGADYFLLGQEHDPELSQAFCELIKQPDVPIAAVFAGHIHLSHAGELCPGRMQYTSAPTFEGVIRKIVLKNCD